AAVLANVIVGWSLGYRDPVAYVAFWAMVIALALTSRNVVSRVFAPGSRVDAWIEGGVIAFAMVVVSGLVLGAIGRVTLGGYPCLQAVLLGVSFVLPKGNRHALPQAGKPPIPDPLAAIVGALAVFSLAYAFTHAPSTLYDSLSYHLFFSARW